MAILIARLLAFSIPALKWAWPYIRAAFIYVLAIGVHTAVVKSLWESMFSKLDGMVTGYTAQMVDFRPLALVNSLFPLSEGLTMLAAYAAVVGVSASIRITKAFIDAKKA